MHILGACHVLEHITSCFEANSHFEHMWRSGENCAFVKILRFDLMISRAGRHKQI